MYYEINVALNGTHFFATAERSATTSAEAVTLYDAICAAFPAEKGYQITVTKWDTCGSQIDMAVQYGRERRE